jgi:hypothetical protein
MMQQLFQLHMHCLLAWPCCCSSMLLLLLLTFSCWVACLPCLLQLASPSPLQVFAAPAPYPCCCGSGLLERWKPEVRTMATVDARACQQTQSSSAPSIQGKLSYTQQKNAMHTISHKVPWFKRSS